MEENISDWLKGQQNWLQKAAINILEQGSLSERDIEEIANYLKTTEGREVSNTRTFPRIGNTTTNEILKLQSIKNISGIDALSPRNPLEFGNDNLIVVYGNNGSGKSGYTRILKKVCGKPNAADLKPNVYQEDAPEAKCTIVYELNGETYSQEWIANGQPIESLKIVDIFDADTAHLYLSQEKEVSYIPKPLQLFDKLVQVSSQVKSYLENEESALTKNLPSLPAQYINTVVGNSYNNLRATYTDVELADIFSWNENDIEKQTELRERLAANDPKSLARKLREKKTQTLNLHGAIKTAFEMVKLDKCKEFIAIKESAIENRKIAQEAAQEQTDLSKLDGVGSNTWRALWEASRNYSMQEAYKEKGFPYVGDDARCVLCHQELGIEAKQRMQDFDNYIKGELEAAAKSAEDLLKQTIQSFPAIPDFEILKTSIQVIELDQDEWGEKLSNVWGLINQKIEELKNSEKEIVGVDEEQINSVLQELKNISEDLEAKAKQYDEDARNFDREQAQRELFELEAKEWTSQQFEAIKAEVQRLKKLVEYKQWKRLTNTRNISTKASEVSENIITQAYIDRFNEELQKLGASRLQVKLIKTRSSLGRVKHQIKLKDAVTDLPITKVLSDGEQRVVALAGFLADVTAQTISAPFIFDDPISSLDQDFEEATINRLVELSEHRQVIVFTHRLSFLGIIVDLADRINQINIRREPWGTGEVGEIPIFGKRPERALKSLKSDRLARAKNIYNEHGYDEYYPLAKAICSDYRILIERVVELYFLADVVQRHRRAVNTMGKIAKLANITTDDCNLIDHYMTKYSAYEHSQPTETPPILPKPDEIEADINAILDWYDDFKTR